MPAREIWHEVKIKASPNAIYNALIDPDRLAKWWMPDVRGVSEEGRVLEFWYGGFCQDLEVVELKPDQLVHWRAGERGIPDWVGTDVEFALRQVEGATLLDLRHTGWREDAAIFPHSSWAWALFLTSLKDLIETGTGSPLPNRWIGS